MPYLGTEIAQGFTSSAKDRFSGDNSTTGFTLSRAVPIVNDIQVFVDNIRQEPTIAYSVSGSTLTFTEAPPTGTNNVYVVHTGQIGPTILPPQDLGTTDYIFGDDISLKSDASVLNFGTDSEVNITHVHNTGLLLNSTNQLQFGDSGTYIHQSADGVLDLVSDTELELNATTIDINGAVDISGNITLGGNIVSATTITTTGNEDSLTLASTDADANSGPHLILDRQSESPADNDYLGQIVFRGKNDAGQNVDYASMRGFIADASDGDEGADIDIITHSGGSTRNRLQFAETETIFNQNQVDIDFRVETDSNANGLLVNAGTNRVGVLGDPSYPFHVQGNNVGFTTAFWNDGDNVNREGIIIQCGTDAGTGTNVPVTFSDGNGDAVGTISFSSGTVSYNAFSASHYCIVPNADNDSSSQDNAYPYGTLLEITSIAYTQKNGSNTERGILYNVQKTQSANSKKVLGAYCSSMNGGSQNYTNMHQVYVVGDGHILCNNSGGNISIGDGICSSSTAGIGQKATANPSMIIGMAQEDVTFSGSETKLVAVQYGLQQFVPWS